MLKGYVFKIKEGKEVVWKDWSLKIENELKEEAVETIREESCEREISMMFKIDDVWYAILAGDGECLPANMDREINKKHREIKRECFEKRIDIETLYDLNA